MKAYIKSVLLVIVVVVGIIAAGVWGPHAAQPIQGDALGPERDESAQQYAQRAEESLSTENDEPHFALVTFAEPTPASALDEVGRVNAIIVGMNSPIAVPEPIEGETRADVFVREGAQLIDAAVVWERPSVLRSLQTPLFVEVAPGDAAWNGFAVRPAQGLRDK